MNSILIRNVTVLTVSGTIQILKDQSLYIEGNKIKDIGPAQYIAKHYPTAERVFDGKHKLVIPGLINSHVHMSLQLARGSKPDKKSIDLPHNTWAMNYAAVLTPEEEYYGNLIGYVEMIKSGTTCFGEAGTVHVDKQVEAMEKIGIRGAVGEWIWDRPEVLRISPENAAKEAERIVREYNGANNGRIRAIVSIIGSGQCSDELYVRAKEVARSNATILNAHAAIRPDTASRGDTIKHLDSLGVLDADTILVHVMNIDASDIQILKERKTKVVHCPSSMMRVNRGATVRGKYPEISAHGIPMGLGTDGADVSDFKDMIRAMYLASTLYKDSRMDASIMGAQEAFSSATIVGANVLGWDKEIGSLDVGKKADITIIDMHRSEWQPTIDLLNNLVYSTTGDSVETVIIDGKVVMENRRITTLDEDKIIDKVMEITEPSVWRGRFPWSWLDSKTN